MFDGVLNFGERLLFLKFDWVLRIRVDILRLERLIWDVLVLGFVVLV